MCGFLYSVMTTRIGQHMKTELYVHNVHVIHTAFLAI